MVKKRKYLIVLVGLFILVFVAYIFVDWCYNFNNINLKFTYPIFSKIENGYEIIHLTMTNGQPMYESVGVLQNDDVIIRKQLINGQPKAMRTNGQYTFPIPFKNYDTIIEEIHVNDSDAEGILLYKGFGYFVIGSDHKYLYPLSLQNDSLPTKIFFQDFISSAQQYNQKYGDTFSGGTGLIE